MVKLIGKTTYEGPKTIVEEKGDIIQTVSKDSDALNNSIYYSKEKQKLVYKDSSGNIHILY